MKKVHRSEKNSEMVWAIITARMGSTRLPNKILLDICGKPMLWHVVNRVMASKLINKIVIATDTKSPEILDFAVEYDIPVYAGADDDILDRLYQASKGAKIIVRIWGDSPLVNADIIDDLIRFFVGGKYDYAYNKGYPEGQNVAVVSYKTLRKAWETIKDPKDREWIHTYFTNTKDYKVGIMENETDLSSVKLSVDTAEDLERIRGLIERSQIINRL